MNIPDQSGLLFQVTSASLESEPNVEKQNLDFMNLTYLFQTQKGEELFYVMLPNQAIWMLIVSADLMSMRGLVIRIKAL